MPVNEFPKLKPHPAKAVPAPEILTAAEPAAPYAELAVTSNYTFLKGASHPEELVARAAALGYTAIALTDRNSLAGIVRAHVAAKQAGIRLLVGARVGPFEDHSDGPTVILLATAMDSYRRLCRLLTLGKRRAAKGECRLNVEDLTELNAGLLAIVMPDVHDIVRVEALLARLRPIFDDDRLSLGVFMHRGVDDAARVAACRALADRCGVHLAATNDVLYHAPERRMLQDVLGCIRMGCTLDTAGRALEANAERHLKTAAQMHGIFAGIPGAIARAVAIARRASGFTLDELRYEYPEEIVPRGSTAQSHLERLAWAGAAERWGHADRVPAPVKDQIRHELALIAELNYAPYFLTVHDLVVFARSRGILCQGRGAAANSAVCYCLGVTAVDPSRVKMLFERFISKERNEPPDIDIDFE
ncbi:MAG: PHP domain-containing protein, partial [Planctomycetes bacterium]|nr:PHP domain-containing protein [Planctomycetota bacterium]